MGDETDFLMTSEDDVKISGSFIRSVQECEDLCRLLRIKEDYGQMMKTREDQVRNTAGGFVFAVSDETRIRRFIILGTSGGTYYSTKKQLTMDNVNALIDIIERGRGSLILKEVYEVSLAGRSPKQDPLLLALALCARYNVYDSISNLNKNKEALERRDVTAAELKYLHGLHKSAFRIVNQRCRIPTHLFTLVKYCEMVSKSTQSENGKKSTGWRRFMRSPIQWYTYKTPCQVAVHITKYPQRDGWSHRDLFRLAHPTLKVFTFPTTILEYEQLYHFAVKGELKIRKRNLSREDADFEQPASKYSAVQIDTELGSKALDLIGAVMALKGEKDEAKVVAAIKTHHLIREHMPTDMLSSVAVWQAVLDGMPMTAMIRNLGKIQSIRILIAKTIYESGHGHVGNLHWEVDGKVIEALEVAFCKSFVNAAPSSKRYCFAFDISGSLKYVGLNVWYYAVMSMCKCSAFKNEKIAECVGLSDNLIELPYNGEWTISSIVEHMDGLDCGGTDCALPMLWAKEKEKKFDVFVVYADNETWFGDVQPYQALRDYRELSGIVDAKLIVMGMIPADFTIADPDDAGMLDIVGFDSAVPTLLHEFVTGKI